ncbi:MAG: 5'-methylthioadenosine/S-adenosylhomocysteine nucleosidase [Clostridia bacterium]|nr:5'-methylthioadenosine/S-adenosylhomocysteine nucleosidase [Clostridia bacterium]
MKIGILCAMRSEFDQLTPYLHIEKKMQMARTDILEGDVDGMPIVLAASGIGKVNAAITAQMLIDRFQVTHMMMVGVAGGMDTRLGVHALAFSEQLAQHDVNPQWLRHRPAPDQGYFPGDPWMLGICHRLQEEGKFLYPAFFGTMVSGEQFIAEEGRQEIIDAWHPLCVDMESAAAAHACFANDIPFMAIRAVSDTAETGEKGFEENEISAADAAAAAAAQVLEAAAAAAASC